jgi:hypothetical protein
LASGFKGFPLRSFVSFVVNGFAFRSRAMTAMSAITAILAPTPFFSLLLKTKAEPPIDPWVTQA